MSKGIALVTGSGQGIGRAISLRFADDGFDVAVNDIPANEHKLEVLVEEIKAKGRKASLVIADVSQEDQVKSMVESVVKNLGGLDVMVANAAICIVAISVIDTTTEDWDRIFAVNVRGTFLCYKYAGLQMVAQGRGGRIIGASSVAGKTGGALAAAYSATKIAIRGLTQSAAQELGPHGITVNAYAPGAIDTDMLRGADEALAEKQGAGLGDFYKHISKMSPLGYIGTPADIASLVSYIASKEAHFITGQSISCNGGIHLD